jgi:hypothetical protein
MFESVIDGPMHAMFKDVTAPEQRLGQPHALRTFAPWEAERCRTCASPIPGRPRRRALPMVRKPVATLPSTVR